MRLTRVYAAEDKRVIAQTLIAGILHQDRRPKAPKESGSKGEREDLKSGGSRGEREDLKSAWRVLK